MTAIDINQTLIESYFNLLNQLSRDNKLNLISRLSQSMMGSTTSSIPPKTIVYELFGAFQSNQTAEQVISEIQQARLFNRQRERF